VAQTDDRSYFIVAISVFEEFPEIWTHGFRAQHSRDRLAALVYTPIATAAGSRLSHRCDSFS
jgi:hypothetical protein